MRAERRLHHGGHGVRGDRHPGRGHLLGGHQPVHRRDDHRATPSRTARRARKAGRGAGCRARRRSGRAAARRRAAAAAPPPALAGERARHPRVLGVQPLDAGALDPAHRQERQPHLRGPQLGEDRDAAALRAPRSRRWRRPGGRRGRARGPARTRRSSPRRPSPRPAAMSRSTSMLCAEPTRCRSRRPCRISARTSAIGSRAHSPPPSATSAPSVTSAAASSSAARLSRSRWKELTVGPR